MSFQLSPQLKMFLFGLSLSGLILVSFFAGGLADRMFVIRPLDVVTGRRALSPGSSSPLSNLLNAGTSVADIAEGASQSVVTISIKKQQRVFSPFGDGVFGIFGQVPRTEPLQDITRDIGTGFVVEQGLVVTNKHVVADQAAEYSVIDREDKEYKIGKIYRDPTTDLAIVEVAELQLPALRLGDSSKLRVGEAVIAIGTALGEFRHTVTTGVVSGLGRGIEATDGFGIESLEGVIQTDAAINPGNSGGPLLSGSGEVIGVNVATSMGANNVSFALPINIIKSSIENFRNTGSFNRPFLGVAYRSISQQAALFNEVPQGAYLLEVKAGSPAATAGLHVGDIVSEFDGMSLKTKDLATLINQKKVDEQVKIKYFRDGEEKTVEVVLKADTSQ
jgi:serine protease Do